MNKKLIDISINKIKKEALKNGLEIKPAFNAVLNDEKCWTVGPNEALYTRNMLVMSYLHNELY